jgi:hypothetical protein
VGAAREWKTEDVERSAEVEPATATSFNHGGGAGELKTREAKPVAGTHGEDGAAVELRPEGDQQADVAEEVQKRCPHDRPCWRVGQINSR